MKCPNISMPELSRLFESPENRDHILKCRQCTTIITGLLARATNPEDGKEARELFTRQALRVLREILKQGPLHKDNLRHQLFAKPAVSLYTAAHDFTTRSTAIIRLTNQARRENMITIKDSQIQLNPRPIMPIPPLLRQRFSAYQQQAQGELKQRIERILQGLALIVAARSDECEKIVATMEQFVHQLLIRGDGLGAETLDEHRIPATDDEQIIAELQKPSPDLWEL